MPFLHAHLYIGKALHNINRLDATPSGPGTGGAAKVSEAPEDRPRRQPDRAAPHVAAALMAGRGVPLRVGQIQIDEQGRIRRRDEPGPLRFEFAYRGVEYGAEVETAADPRVRLTAELGKLPYSIEIGDRRRLIRRILRASERAPRGRIVLSDSDDMRLEAASAPPEPFTPASLMATLAALLLELQPYLDLLGRALSGTGPAETIDVTDLA